MRIAICGGRVLLPTGEIAQSDVTVEDGRIAGIGTNGRADLVLMARDRLVLPGLIDIHGDSFEHFILPRPTSRFPLDIALAEADRQFMANGVTTAFLAQGHSWEGGLRGAEQADEIVAWLARNRRRLRTDIRIHLRHETFHVDGVAAVETWLRQRAIDLLVFNDHLPSYESRLDDSDHLSHWAGKAGLSTSEFAERIRRARRRESEVEDSIARLSRAAAAAGIVTGSHDDESPAIRAHYTALGATLAEFPLDLETAAAARTMGQPVVLGAPNVVRGGSSAGNVSATDVIAAGYCDVLCSDYYMPALLAAPFQLAEEGVLGFAEAWGLVSAGPARAAGLKDRGAIANGLRADLVVLDDRDAGRPRVDTTIVGGRIVFTHGDLLEAA